MKRLNPDTGKPFIRGDKREDGFLFDSYSKRIKKNGEYTELWINPDSQNGKILLKTNKKGEKRINPRTGQLFKKGDKNSEGMFFMKYLNWVDKNNYYHESWKSLKELDESRLSIRERIKTNRELVKKGKIKKRINPLTGKYFKKGDKRKQDNKIFRDYNFVSINSDFPDCISETWISPDSYHLYMLKHNVVEIKTKCRKNKIKFDEDILDHLIKIYPKDSICPISGEKMIWGNNNSTNSNSPSVDRIIPSLGYVKKIVRWILQHCNLLKSDRNIELLEKIYFDIKKIKNKKIYDKNI